MLAIFDVLTTILSFVVPIVFLTVTVLREKANQSAERRSFYTKASFILGWLLVVVMFAAGVVSLLKGDYFFMVLQFILFAFFVRYMNRDTAAHQKA
jgi:quinol-cytochrome oxidoreductase complex cytochrome b subunit